MYIVFLALLIIFKIVLSVLGALEEKKLKGVVITEKIRCKSYCQMLAILWGATFAVFIMSFIGNIGFADIGFRPINFNKNIWFTVIVLVLGGLVLVFSLYRIIFSLTSAKYREKIKKAFVDDDGASVVVPRTKKEKRLFSLVSLTAGICEEIIYRGFVVFLFHVIFPDIPIALIIIIPSVLFGIGHLYQGLQGVISTGIIGALFMCLFLVTDSLILVMFLHFILDFSSTFLLSEDQAK
jgi:membrane protease YdiL (CAAX protease family)